MYPALESRCDSVRKGLAPQPPAGAGRFGRRVFLTAVAASMLGAATGCSFFASGRETLVVDSDPQGAEVTIPGCERATTPASLSVSCDRDITVVIRKEGYHPHVQTVRRTVSKYGMADAIGGVVFLVPALGFLSPGAYSLQQHALFVPLIRKTDVAAPDAPAAKK